MAEMSRAYIGLGSNLGDRAANLAEARRQLAEAGRIVAVSSIYETEPWGVGPGQPDYLNQVVAMATPLPPSDLLKELLRIERKMGRVRSAPGDARVIDLDLLLYGDEVIDEPGLTLPHPRMCDRAFVLTPLAEIAPDTVHPANGLTIGALNASVDHSGVRLWRRT